MSKVISLRLKDEQFERLGRLATRWARNRSDTAARLLEESLRREEFPPIEFRNTASGREAFIAGTRLKVWMMASFAEEYPELDDSGRAEKIAKRLEVDVAGIEAALAYTRAFPEEIEAALADRVTNA